MTCGSDRPTGISIKIGYRGNIVVAGYTGCRLPRDKKQQPPNPSRLNAAPTSSLPERTLGVPESREDR